MPTDDDRDWLTQARARCEAATAGPWDPCKTAECICGIVWSTALDVTVCVCKARDWGAKSRPDAEFIAHAREDLPYALDCIEAADRLAEATVFLASLRPNGSLARAADAYREARRRAPGTK